MEMDTDSAYMALYAPMHLVVRPGMRRGFYKNYGDWFPRPYCEQHREDFVKTQMAEGGDARVPGECCANQHKHDKGTLGLFKVEFEGTGMVALNLKTYHCWGSAGVLLLRRRVTRGSVSGLTSLQRRSTGLC